MSRSRRHTPICGISKAKSDKPEKILAHRAFRAALRRVMARGEHEMPSHRQYGGSWTMAKDGKQFLTAATRAKYPELLRK